jgi:membrane protein implicated in regulation of membrane protease activity
MYLSTDLPTPNTDVHSRQQGIVKRTITPQLSGRVYFQSTYWPARLLSPATCEGLQPGDPVEVVGREWLTLLVQPLAQRRESS